MVLGLFCSIGRSKLMNAGRGQRKRRIGKYCLEMDRAQSPLGGRSWAFEHDALGCGVWRASGRPTDTTTTPPGYAACRLVNFMIYDMIEMRTVHDRHGLGFEGYSRRLSISHPETRYSLSLASLSLSTTIKVTLLNHHYLDFGYKGLLLDSQYTDSDVSSRQLPGASHAIQDSRRAGWGFALFPKPQPRSPHVPRLMTEHYSIVVLSRANECPLGQ